MARAKGSSTERGFSNPREFADKNVRAPLNSELRVLRGEQNQDDSASLPTEKPEDPSRLSTVYSNFELIGQLQKLHENSRSDAPHVPAIDVKMIARMAAR